MIVIGYYTRHTPYVDEAVRLILNLEKWKLDYDIRAVPNFGTWQKNTQFKASFVREMMRVYPKEPLLYLDVDAEILAPLHNLARGLPLGTDIAAAKFGGHELLSGTVWFNCTPTARYLVDCWIDNCALYPETLPGGLLPHHSLDTDAWDQRILDLSIREVNAAFFELPPAYCYIHDLSLEKYPGVVPIIRHRAASRWTKDAVLGRRVELNDNERKLREMAD